MTLKRISLTLEPIDVELLDKCKKEKFYNKSQAEMMRYLIRKGLAADASKPKK